MLFQLFFLFFSPLFSLHILTYHGMSKIQMLFQLFLISFFVQKHLLFEKSVVNYPGFCGEDLERPGEILLKKWSNLAQYFHIANAFTEKRPKKISSLNN